MSSSERKDFFVSYNEADREWAVWIAWELEEAGYNAVLQAWDFPPGTNFVLEMDRASKVADRTIPIISPDYISASFPQPEWAAAFTSDPQGLERKLVPVRVRECSLQGLLANIVYIDLVGLESRTAAREALLEGVAGGRRKPDVAPEYPGEHSDSGPPAFPGEALNEQPPMSMPRASEEQLRRFDRRFDQAIRDLGSEVEAVRVTAAAVLESLLVPEHHEEHELIYRVLCANLATKHTRQVREILKRAFTKALRLHLATASHAGTTPDLKFARCDLGRAELQGLDLSGADFAFAYLKRANLSRSRLFRAKGYLANFEEARLHETTLEEARFQRVFGVRAQFHKARLVSADLKEAELREAEFQAASMQGVHLERADLRGARLDAANLADAYFIGALFDDAALVSILRSSSWRQAHFDPPTLERLSVLS